MSNGDVTFKNEAERKAWCGEFCPEHSRLDDNLKDARGKVSMRIFSIAIGIIVLVFGAVFTLQSKTSSNVTAIDKNTALIQQAQERVVLTLDKIQKKLEDHRDRLDSHK
ncbi:MAG: hypothetical protein FVQ80_07005 [Planctomycetes bacterium]|nr:hypothetical protein [Planctomycetota bacterium]